MSVAKETEIIASSPMSFDAAVKNGIARAYQSLTYLKSAWIQDQEVQVNEGGQITEYRDQLKTTFVLEE